MWLARLQNNDPPVTIVFREKRAVNGKQVCFMILKGNRERNEWVSYGYYYGGTASLQFTVTTTSAMIAKRNKDFMELLNGFQIVE